ncbi:O-methyltransferase [Bacillus sp. HMF5848]|uniref:O-methyltransferase n=1 Tax=Bacillus sp. HMF5848 TaxID=2495421 RepID=UPI000F7990C3|nr:O-methyltransferase [Bacillus sp. HMF5848]RSK27962.1 O-methyltransferase [Bacillus sp. HMF5848]
MLNSDINTYLTSLLPNKSSLILDMERYALEHEVPIMDVISIETLLMILQLQNPKTILELGTAIGYSATRMALALPDTKIVTIERNKERYDKALFYIGQAGLSDRISIIFGDALEVSEQIQTFGVFDAVFIDAAKGQYERFFNLYTPMLTNRGVVISDNVLYKGLPTKEQSEIENRRVRQLVRKIKGYNEWLAKHPSFTTTFVPIGDGLAITRKRGDI